MWTGLRSFSAYSCYFHLFTVKPGRKIVRDAMAAAKLLQLCPTLCDPIDGSLPGSSIPGILQARILQWVAISFSNAWKWKVKVKWLSHVWILATPWTAAYQAPPSIGFSRQEYWNRVPLPSPFETLQYSIISFYVYLPLLGTQGSFWENTVVIFNFD